MLVLAPANTLHRAWHAIKYIDPRESGAVIPILHANGFKISERTIFGCMDDKEVLCLFSGYGYQVRIVEDLENIDDNLQNALEWALAEIRKIQQAARSGNPISKPRWPMLVLRTPKARCSTSMALARKLTQHRDGQVRKWWRERSLRGRSIPTRFLCPRRAAMTRSSRP